MEITTVVGIVIAVIIMLFGLRILFKKPANAAPSLDSELHVDTDSQQPVIPRHVRDQLQSANEPSSIERIEPKLAESAVELAQDAKKAQAKSEHTEAKAPVVAVAAETTNQVESKTDAVKGQAIQAEQTVAKDSVEQSVNANIEKAEIS